MKGTVVLALMFAATTVFAQARSTLRFYNSTGAGPTGRHTDDLTRRSRHPPMQIESSQLQTENREPSQRTRGRMSQSDLFDEEDE